MPYLQDIYANSQKTHLLPPRTRTTTTELLGLHTTGVSNKEGSVVSDEGLFQFQSRCGILVLGVETSINTLSSLKNTATYATTPLAMACRRA